MVKLHLFADNKLVQYATVRSVPRVGDEVRLDGERFFTVKRVIWCLDEITVTQHGTDRANIELEPAP